MTEAASLRVCPKCKEEKPKTLEFFRGHNSKARGFTFSYCRVCAVEVDRIQNARQYVKNSAKMLARTREDRKANPEKHRAWDRKNWEKNREQKRAYKKKAWAECDQRAAVERVKEWRRNNPDKEHATWRRTYEKHKEKHTARTARWARENPQARAAIMNRRRAREVGAPGDYTKDDVREMLRVYGRVCFYCSTALTKFHVDHFIPLARGGSNDPENLRLACPSCNFSKAARMPWEWMPEKFSMPKCEAA